MTCSPVIVASDIPVLGVSIMNDTHHEEIELINTFSRSHALAWECIPDSTNLQQPVSLNNI